MGDRIIVPPPGTRRRRRPTNSHPGRSASAPGPTALVAEDDPDLSTALVDALRGADYRPRAVPTALGALRIVAHDEPDIVLPDLGLPDVDGADFTRGARCV